MNEPPDPQKALDQLPEKIRPPLQSDTQSKKLAEDEAKGFAEKNLDNEAKQNEHTRNQIFRATLHRVFICGIWFCSGLMMAGAFILAWHELAPDRWHGYRLTRSAPCGPSISAAL